MPTKVLMFGWEFPPMITGGLGTACLGITEGLAENGVKVTFVMPHLQGENPYKHLEFVDASKVPHKYKDIDILTIDSTLLPYQTFDEYITLINKGNFIHDFLENNPNQKSLYGQNIFQEVERFKRSAASITEQNDFDVIHAHDWMTAQAGVEAKKSSGKPLVLHIHATEMDRTLGNPDQRIYDMEKDAMEIADKIIAVSEWTKKTILKYYPIDPNKIVVVHNAVEQLKAKAFFRSKILKKDKIVLFLGRMTMMKGPEYFIQAAKKVLDVDPNIKFVMAGTGDSLKKIINLSIELGISKKVMFLGFYDPSTVDRMCSTCNLLVMPSVSEPFGIVPLEAARNKVPVIISKSSGVAEILNNALKVDFWDIDEMANKILAVLKYQPLHTQLRTDALGDLKNLTWLNQAKKIQHVYNSVVNIHS